MTHEEQLEKIVKKEKEKDLIPFFKALSPEERKTITPYVKQLHKEYTKMRERRVMTSISYYSKGTPQQIHILSVAAFMCYNRKDFEKLAWGVAQIIDKKVLDPILEWYCPEWFSDYINGYAQQNWVPPNVNYLWLMELEERRLVKVVPELLVRALQATVYDYGNREPVFIPQNLLRYSRTLEQDIWLFFQYESPINWAGRHMRFSEEQAKEGTDWITIFKKYCAVGKIDRERLLHESLMATTRNFNKALSVWFAELFTSLEPSKEELIHLQDALFTSFNSPHSKPVQTALQCSKIIIDAKEFKVGDFLQNVPLLLASETKSLLSNCLQILDKLAKKHKDKRPAIVQLASQALIHKQDEIQVKAAKLIQAYGDLSSFELKETLEAYRDNLMVNARTLLNDFFKEKETMIEQQEIPANISYTRNKQELAAIKNTDELVFLASQAFDNNVAEHFDLLPAALIRLQFEIRGEVITRLEPALQRAFKLVMGDWRSSIGYLDHLLATFFIDYCKFLINQYPAEAQSLKVIQDHYIRQDNENTRRWGIHMQRIKSLDEWISIKGDTLYQAHKNLLITALYKLRNNDQLPLLSTPTHTLGLIDPVQLVDRLKAYQEQDIEPRLIDFQVAISRCDLEKATEALPYAAKQLSGEYNRLFRFLLQQDAIPEEPFIQESIWMIAALAKNPATIDPALGQVYQRIAPELLTGQYSWRTFTEDYTIDQYNWENGKLKTIKVPAKRQVLRLSMSDKNAQENNGKPQESGFKKLFSKFFTAKKETVGSKGTEPLFYEWLSIKSMYVTTEANDIERLLHLVPNNTEPLIAEVIRKYLVQSTLKNESEKKMVNATLLALHGLWKDPGEMAHLLVATCMICSDKTAASFALEIWINGVQSGTMNSALIGSIIGKHEQVEFAPLKRWTALVMNQLLNISPKYNRELEKLLTALIRELPKDPLRNLKKLLEIYLEVLSINGSSIDATMYSQLENWKCSASLEKVIRALAETVDIPFNKKAPV